MKHIAIDIGGSWIKGTLVENYPFTTDTPILKGNFDIKRVKSPLNEYTKLSEVMNSLTELFSHFDGDLTDIDGIGISTPGIVNYHGSKLMTAGPHLNILKNESWKNELTKMFDCPVHLINDADAATIGLCELGHLEGNKTIGVMPIGTGLGFSIWRNGRRWRPGKSLPLLGNVKSGTMQYNQIVSASILASVNRENNLLKVLSNDEYSTVRKSYFINLISVIQTAAILYNLDEIILCGGLVDAAKDAHISLESEIKKHLPNPFDLFGKKVNIRIAREGNHLQLIGNLALIYGELAAKEGQMHYQYKSLDTEIPYQQNGFHPEKMKSADIIKKLWHAEQEAADDLKDSLYKIAEIVDLSVKRIENGGRIIYVGAGTSGRIAAMDAVEIPCTYGFPEDRILTLIAGGVSDSAMEIESNFEEDASAVPEMLLLNIQPNDVVIGISASGSAYYVQSALAMAKSKQAMTVMLQAKGSTVPLDFCDHLIALHSGRELIGGSTRMKAGTATKKVLNFFSSTLMMKLGKVIGSYMIDVVCTNDKLVERAQNILSELYDITPEDSLKRLKKSDMHLGKVIEDLNSVHGIRNS